jgi:recombination protein U
MTQSESKFREYLKKCFEDPKLYIKKLPDKKQIGLATGLGLPDYLVIYQSIVLFFEVKMSSNKKSFPLSDISESQFIEFNKIIDAGGTIYLAIYVNKELYIINYKSIQILQHLTNEKSISIEQLDKWRVKWSQIKSSQP